MALSKLFRRNMESSPTIVTAGEGPAPPTPSPPAPAGAVPAAPSAPESDPLRELWRQGRYAVLAARAEQWREHPDGPRTCAASRDKLDEELALVPEGVVALPTSLDDHVGAEERDVAVRPFLLDVLAVTNARFQFFVDGGGYDDLQWWPEQIWPHLIEMHDQTGHSAPRFWRQGRHDPTLADHPVVGVSWYEANAFARWAGKRLPTEAEWQMAASWHLKSEANVLRRFPWGDAMDQARCNIWASRIGGTVSVEEYAKGAAPNGVRQLIGNVWEWTASGFEITDAQGKPILGEMPMYSIRGGAFETYFESQATGLFSTGHIALGRTHNLGFRGALDLPESERSA